MSYCTVYAIEANGDVVNVGEASNNHAFAPWAWDVIAKKSGFGRFPWGDEERMKEFWKLCGSGKLSERDDVVLRLTFDNVWVRRENVRATASALVEFFVEHGSGIAPTMRGVADLMAEAVEEAGCRGVCFNLCSANANPWVVYYLDMDDDEKRDFRRGRIGEGPTEEEICEFMEEVEGECRPFNFDRDVGKKRVWKLDPRELFEPKG